MSRCRELVGLSAGHICGRTRPSRTTVRVGLPVDHKESASSQRTRTLKPRSAASSVHVLSELEITNNRFSDPCLFIFRRQRAACPGARSPSPAPRGPHGAQRGAGAGLRGRPERAERADLARRGGFAMPSAQSEETSDSLAGPGRPAGPSRSP